ncbi:MAG: ribonuclease P protein component [Bacillota bacterium]
MKEGSGTARRTIRKRDFERIFKQGRSSSSGCIVVYKLRNHLPVYRLGFAVSRKVGKAVKRNRVRRLLREVCRLNPGWFIQGYDYVVLGRVSAGEEKYQTIQKVIRQALKIPTGED